MASAYDRLVKAAELAAQITSAFAGASNSGRPDSAFGKDSAEFYTEVFKAVSESLKE